MQQDQIVNMKVQGGQKEKKKSCLIYKKNWPSQYIAIYCDGQVFFLSDVISYEVNLASQSSLWELLTTAILCKRS